MSAWIDITVPIARDMAVWPGNDQPTLHRTAFYEEGADSITSVLTTDLHNGTHVDAPFHFLDGGETIETIDLDTLMGDAVVVELPENVQEVDAAILAEHVPAGAQRVLLKTKNSRNIGNSRYEFDTSFAALTTSAARWLVDAGVKLVGIDYLSIAVFDGDPETHRVLMRNGVTILEGLRLEHAKPGPYELRALPLKILDAEAAPARALLRPI